MPYYVYILQSLKDSKYYVGSTSNVENRLQFHNAGLQRSTRSRIAFQLILIEEYTTKTESLKREKQFKSWKGGKACKFKLIYRLLFFSSINFYQKISKLRLYKNL